MLVKDSFMLEMMSFYGFELWEKMYTFVLVACNANSFQ